MKRRLAAIFAALLLSSVTVMKLQLLHFEKNFREEIFREQQLGGEKRQKSLIHILSDEVQAKIWKRQNPENCNDVRILVYDIKARGAGFAATMHVIIQHFLLALCRNRTFVLNSDGWMYDAKGWDHYFLPIGKCKYNGDIESLPQLTDKVSDIRVVSGVDRELFDHYNWKVPRNILPKLNNFHRDPFGWWIGQFVKYLFRLQPWVVEVLKKREKTVPFTTSTIGLQIRWGNKIGKEALRHPVSEYMELASEWFKRPEHQNSTKTIFVATEESEAWRNLEDSFPDFLFIGSGYVSRYEQLDIQFEAKYGSRRNELDAIVTDLHFLFKCPYVVCTYSSNICRLLYELMATHNNNPEDAIVSLDVTFYHIKGARSYRVIDDSTTDGKLELKIGDVCETENERFHPRKGGGAYLRVTNTRTGQKGLLVPKQNLEIIVEPLDFDM